MSLMSEPKRKRKTLKKLHFNQAFNITQNQTTGLLTALYSCVVHVISMMHIPALQLHCMP